MATWTWIRWLAAAGFRLGLVVCCVKAVQAQSDRAASRRLRISDAALERVVVEGRRRSLTFASLLDELERSHAIVYIFRVPYIRGKLEGCVALNPGGAGKDRYLRIAIMTGLRDDRTITVIGHELQHVMEILEAETKGELQHGFGALVSQVRSGQYETQAAIDTGTRIAAELHETSQRKPEY